MKLKQFQALQAVALSGSIQEAATRLCLTQPAVSRSIREFESELGIPLLVRTARGATLTDYADRILKRVRAIDREVARIQEEADEIRGLINGRLAIGLAAPTADAAVIETIAEFANARPNVQLKVMEMRTQQIEEGLRNGSIDVGIVTHFRETETLPYEAEFLYEAEMVLTVSKLYDGPSHLSVGQLRELPWLTLDLELDSNSFINALFDSANLPVPERIIYSSSPLLYLGLARRTGAVGIWSEMALPFLQPLFEQQIMRRISVRERMPRMTVRLACADRDLMSRPARDFSVWIRNRLTGSPGRFDPADSFLFGGPSHNKSA
ncbi:LysR family transcriptional regulator [Paraburkholderia phytofirmans]|uniref:LysR family transcriptional regulator n=1 Tax=Paraburkholderia phytofirmans TaxID=261302 RepID=UPI0038B6F880